MNNDLEELLHDLIAIRSIDSKKDSLKAAIAYIKAYFASCKEFKTYDFDFDVAPCLLVAKELFIDYDIIFSVHIDVVDGKDSQFEAITKDGKIFGRGAADMKAACAVVMQMMKELATRPESNKVAVLFTSDEETTSVSGKRAILDSRLQGKCVVIPDTKCWGFDHLVNEAKGIVFMRLSTRAIYNQGNPKSAIALVLEDLNAVKSIFKNDPAVWGSTMNIGRIDGGKNGETIADSAEVFLDVRFSREETAKNCVEKISAVLQYAHIEILGNEPAVYI